MNQTDLERTLVDLVRQTTPLWDKYSNSYLNKKLKWQLWEDIAKKLNSESKNCMLRWKALREKYIRQKTKFQQEGEKWELLDDMCFLDKVIQYRKKDYNYVQPLQSEIPELNFYSTHESRASNYDEESSLNGSSSDLLIQIKDEEVHDDIQNSLPDSSTRKRLSSCTSDALPEKRQKEERHVEEKIGKSPEEIFGNLVSAMLSKKPERERNLCMIEIMTILSK